MKRVQRFWSSWHEAIEVVIVGSIFSVGANLLRVVGNNIASQREIDLRTHTRNMTSAFEIDGLTWLQLTQSADYPESWIMPMAILINLATLYFTVRNDELILAIRVIATGESFNRLGYMLVKTTVDFCGFFVDPQCTNIPFVKPIVRDINKVLLINMFLQMIISFSRFMAVSFGGRYFSYAHKWPFAQLAVGYVLAAGAIVLTKHLWDIYLFDYWGILATITVCFMVTMDCFTFRAFRNWKKAKPDAERRLMYQVECFVLMMCSSLIYLIDYVGTNVFVILTIEFDLTGPTPDQPDSFLFLPYTYGSLHARAKLDWSDILEKEEKKGKEERHRRGQRLNNG
ncbi:unnamed protein product, partial [Mesorhabditis belari]|uniref:Uncharacterized protein n=1 Tax=Mesorhabditis belari TaxID=2138241 RepID=A0AAF3F6D2_9BILA